MHSIEMFIHGSGWQIEHVDVEILEMGGKVILYSCRAIHDVSDFIRLEQIQFSSDVLTAWILQNN